MKIGQFIQTMYQFRYIHFLNLFAEISSALKYFPMPYRSIATAKPAPNRT